MVCGWLNIWMQNHGHVESTVKFYVNYWLCEGSAHLTPALLTGQQYIMATWMMRGKNSYLVSLFIKTIILSEAEDIKKRWQEYTEELYKKDLHNTDNHDEVITNLEPDILECEVK